MKIMIALVVSMSATAAQADWVCEQGYCEYSVNSAVLAKVRYVGSQDSVVEYTTYSDDGEPTVVLMSTEEWGFVLRSYQR